MLGDQRIDKIESQSQPFGVDVLSIAPESITATTSPRIAICVRSLEAVVFLGIAMTVVQALDGVIGAAAHDPSKTYGPFALAVLNALAVGWLLRPVSIGAANVARDRG